MTQDLPAHAVIRPLSLKDIDGFLRVEEAAFPAEERCSREKALYRLKVCPELSAGVFLREFRPLADALSPDGQSSDQSLPPPTSCLVSERLVAHILATKMTSEFVTDEAMEIPDLDEYGRALNTHDPRGHHEEGRSIGIHSVAVDPDFQGRSIGTLMLKDYIQRITTQHIADRIVIIAHDSLVPFYKRLDFVDEGPSKEPP